MNFEAEDNNSEDVFSTYQLVIKIYEYCTNDDSNSKGKKYIYESLDFNYVLCPFDSSVVVLIYTM